MYTVLIRGPQQEMLSKVGRELMILGFIAFGVILLKELNVFVWSSSSSSGRYGVVGSVYVAAAHHVGR